jgi:16S rRNA (uracil1498-N3)-methyltransferase
MKFPRIYQSGHYKTGDTVALTAAAAQHVGLVLRMKVGEPLVLFPGNNYEYAAVITRMEKKQIQVSIGEATLSSKESPRQIHLAQAISKGERMELVIQKAVELGVTSITPLLTARCVVRLDADRMGKKKSQWESIAIAACEQSGRNMIPIIHETLSLSAYLKLNSAKMCLTLSPMAKSSWRDLVFNQDDIAILIGPEGGLNENEIAEAERAGFQSISLGPRILRTETAAITALSLLQAIAGDL